MTEADDEDDRKRLRAAENLGWLAESGTYSKKRKFIEGMVTQGKARLICHKCETFELC